MISLFGTARFELHYQVMPGSLPDDNIKPSELVLRLSINSPDGEKCINIATEIHPLDPTSEICQRLGETDCVTNLDHLCSVLHSRKDAGNRVESLLMEIHKELKALRKEFFIA